MDYVTTYNTEAQINADRANFYFATRAHNASPYCHASDFKKAVPDLTWEQSQILAAAMVSILQGYSAEARTSTGGETAKIVW